MKRQHHGFKPKPSATFAIGTVSVDDAKWAAKQMNKGILQQGLIVPRAGQSQQDFQSELNQLSNAADLQGGSGPPPDTEPGTPASSFVGANYSNPPWQAAVRDMVAQFNADKAARKRD